MIQVHATSTFDDWYRSLPRVQSDAIFRLVHMLSMQGVTLRFPYSSGIKGTERHALRELRAQGGGRPLRVFYAFDPTRSAVLLVGGDKTGDRDFYRRNVRLAERLFDDWLDALDRDK